jgi:phosphate uptake regulator
MKRKLISQGGSALTITLPSKWLKANSLKGGDEIDLEEEANILHVSAKGSHAQDRSIMLELDFERFNSYRSIIGGLYRGGYSEIRLKFTNPKVIPLLQKTVDSLYGLELFDMDEKSCTIRSIFKPEVNDLRSHINRMVHNVVTMHSILMRDIKSRSYAAKDEMFQFRNNVLKARDLVARTVVEQKCLDSKNFPYYMISHSIWNVARSYYLLYENLEPKKYPQENMKLLEETSAFFQDSFRHIGEKKYPDNIYIEYDRIRASALKQMKGKEASIIVSFCINMLMAIQGAESSMLLLDLE